MNDNLDAGRALLLVRDRTARLLDVGDRKTRSVIASTLLASAPDGGTLM